MEVTTRRKAIIELFATMTEAEAQAFKATFSGIAVSADDSLKGHAVARRLAAALPNVGTRTGA